MLARASYVIEDALIRVPTSGARARPYQAEGHHMKYRQFGRTGWQVSEIAFGGWQLGGDWGPVDDQASIRTLHHSFASGINFVDTAELYGHGHSEEVIGQALRQWRAERNYVAAKVQPTVGPDPGNHA